MSGRETQTQTQRDRERQTDTDTEIERQRDRETETETETDRETQTERESEPQRTIIPSLADFLEATRRSLSGLFPSSLAAKYPTFTHHLLKK